MSHLHKQKKRRILSIVIFLFTLSLACSLPFVGDSNLEGRDGAGTTPTVGSAGERDLAGDLRCEQQGYPCSYAGASREALERGLEVMDLAKEVFEEEGDAIAVAERLKEETDIVEMYYDERGVWYRVEGAPPLVFLHPEVYQIEGQEAGSLETGSAARKVQLLPPIPQSDGPVGENPPGEKVEKRALFLSPFAWQFDTDVYDHANSLLKKYRDYRCDGCVELFSTPSNPEEEVDEDNPGAGPSVEQFQNWQKYDLIHVFAHGNQFCPGQTVTSSGKPVVSGDREDIPENTGAIIEGVEVTEGDCVTIIQTGHFRLEADIVENPSQAEGVVWVYKVGSETWMEAVTTDFFHNQYPDGLDEKIIYFTSCQGLRDDSLAQALMGNNTAVLGWSDTVGGGRGIDVANRFYLELIDKGLRVSIAHQKTVDSSSHTEHPDDWKGAELVLERVPESDPRGREVITWLHPVYRDKLQEIGHIPVRGIPGDQEPDHLMVLLQIDGMDEEYPPEDYTVYVKVNGEEVGQQMKPTTGYSQTANWVQAEVPLPDDSNNIPEVKIEAWVNLPEGGESRHVLEEVELADCGWRGVATGSQGGPISGTEVIDSKDIANVDLKELGETLGMEDLQQRMPPSYDMESPGAGERFFFLSDEGGTPFVGFGDAGPGALYLDLMTGYAGRSVQYELTRDDGKVIKGSMFGEMRGGSISGGEEQIQVEADFEWHVGSLCSMKLKMQGLDLEF